MGHPLARTMGGDRRSAAILPRAMDPLCLGQCGPRRAKGGDSEGSGNVLSRLVSADYTVRTVPEGVCIRCT